MNRKQRFQYFLLVSILLAALFLFWKWWLEPAHNINAVWYVLTSLVLAWVSLVPLYLIFIFARSRVPAQVVPIPDDYRVAMVVTKAPSEPFAIVRETLNAMLRQSYPHDTWLADEDPTRDVIEWCRSHGVHLSTRKDNCAYHRSDWPRRTGCKEGNLAFFYDHYGYENYDFVVQLDADHVPEDGYLEEMLRPFTDPGVGYVSAPSICDSNALESWSARGRLYAEAGLHGPLQAGYTGGLAPLCIGSHYAVRTEALKEIGGLGPELAEDHSTTLIMNAHGWRGVHAINAFAHGRGPQSFPDLVTQEFQWSRSLITILLRYTPKYFSALPLALKFQFAFSESWYPLFSAMMFIMTCLPLVALAYDENLVGVSYPEFFIRAFALWFLLSLIALWWKINGFTRPLNTKAFSWEAILFLFARWPWSLLGSLAGVKDWLMGGISSFRVTSKSRAGVQTLPLGVIFPYAALSAASGLPVIFLSSIETARGFIIFASLNCLVYSVLLVVIVVRHWIENRASDSARCQTSQSIFSRACLGGLMLCAVAIPLIAIPLRVPTTIDALLWRHEQVLDYQRIADVFGLSESQASTAKAASQSGAPKLGVYDPGNVYSGNTGISIDHVFVQWQLKDAKNRVEVALRAANDRNRLLLITLEPWTQARNWVDGGDRLFTEVLAGGYDHKLVDVCRQIGEHESEVWVRWGHEMEDPVDRYPWAQNDARGYIRAFQHVVHLCGSFAPNARFVWSPKGEHGLNRFYPGDRYVDLIGISIYGMKSWEESYYGQSRSAADNVGEKYWRVSRYNKPIIIAELGFYGDETYVRTWMQEFKIGLSNLPLVSAVVYFNDKEPHQWPLPYGAPDWRTNAHLFFSSLNASF